jgi:hypothetical protein
VRSLRSDRLPDVLGAAVEAVPFPRARVDVEAELGRDHHLIADRFERLADEFLVGERAVGLGRVEEGHAQVNRMPDETDHSVPVGDGSVVRAHAHAAKAERGNLQPGTAKLTLLHRFVFLSPVKRVWS